MNKLITVISLQSNNSMQIILKFAWTPVSSIALTLCAARQFIHGASASLGMSNCEAPETDFFMALHMWMPLNPV